LSFSTVARICKLTVERVNVLSDEQLRVIIAKAARKGNISCRWLLGTAKRLGVRPVRLGRLCDRMNIRIRACQLGCFA
jgi:hypothetical protein